MTYHFWEDRQHSISETVDNELSMVRRVAEKQNHAIENANNLLQILSTLPEITSGNALRCRERVSQFFMPTSNYANIVITDASGKLLCAAKGSGSQDFSDRYWYQQAIKSNHFVVGDYNIGRIQSLPIIPLAQAIRNHEGKVQRVILVAINVGWLEHRLKHNQFENEAVLRVLDKNGTLVAQQPSNPKGVGKPYPDSSLFNAIASGLPEGTGETTTNDGKSQLYAYVKLSPNGDDKSNVYVIANIPKNIVVSRASSAFLTNLGLLFALTILGLTMAWFLMDIFVLRRVKALIKTAKSIKSGDFKARAALDQGSSELSELARAFDEMAGSIERAFEQNQRIMEVTPEAILISDHEGRIVMANAQTEAIFGYNRVELIGQPIEILLPESLRSAHVGHRKHYNAAPVTREMGTTNNLSARRKDGTEFPVDVSLGPLKTDTGTMVVCAVRDVSERKKFESTILHQATHDALTDLPNRTLFMEILSHAMTRALRSENLVAVMFLDLDGFKNINDTLGHEQGDRLLKGVANRLVSVLRKDDMVARQGGDEFTILLQGINTVQDIVQIAEKLLSSIAEPIHTGSHEMHITGSIGITVFPFDDTNLENLLRNADTAMYRAKETGKNNYQFYTAEMNAAMQERMEIENGLRRAIQEKQFSLHYQPQIRLGTGEIIGVEALLRWNNSEHGMIPPAKFIPVAEESGLIVPIGEWVLKTACQQIRSWREEGLVDIKIAVNLSPRQFHQPNLVEMIQCVLEETGLDSCSGALELELTESMVMRDVEQSVVTLKKFHQLGIHISIDDFGTGYSSLSYLKRFPIQTLKIDQSFVRDITTDPEDAAIAAAIINLGHSLRLNVIAEGVETAEQLDLLKHMGCDEAQGYYLSKPLPVDTVETVLRNGIYEPASSC